MDLYKLGVVVSLLGAFVLCGAVATNNLHRALLLIVGIGFAIFFSAKEYQRDEKKRISGLILQGKKAISEGKTAAIDGRTEHECPYTGWYNSDPNWVPGRDIIKCLSVAVGGPPDKVHPNNSYECKRYWWLVAYRQQLSELAQPKPKPKPKRSPVQTAGHSGAEDILRAPNGSAREFLYPLSQEEKIAVTGRPLAVYDAVIRSKRSGDAIVRASDSSASDLVSSLTKLDVADVERLAASLKLTLEADRTAATDMARAEQLYQRAFELNPYDAMAAMSYGIILGRRGDREGLIWLELAQDLAPKDERLRERITQNLAAVKSHLDDAGVSPNGGFAKPNNAKVAIKIGQRQRNRSNVTRAGENLGSGFSVKPARRRAAQADLKLEPIKNQEDEMTDAEVEASIRLMGSVGGIIIFGPRLANPPTVMYPFPSEPRPVFSGRRIDEIAIPDTIMIRCGMVFSHHVPGHDDGTAVSDADLKTWVHALMPAIVPRLQPKSVPGLRPEQIEKPRWNFSGSTTGELELWIEWGWVKSTHCVDVARAIEQAYEKAGGS